MELDERKQKILQGVVWSYVETAEPVGSENLAQRYAAWGVKSATIRNTLADLADQGYLRQPHTSAGRIPSDRGYRFYVDHLIVESDVEPSIVEQNRSELDLERTETLDRVLRQTCALLSRMTRLTSVATRPQATDTTLRQVFVAPASSDAVLMVALLSSGDSETRILAGAVADHALEEPSSLNIASNAVNLMWAGKSLDIIANSSTIDLAPPRDLTGLHVRAIYGVLADSLRHIARSIGGQRAVFDGAREMMKQPEFQDSYKLEPVLDILQNSPHFVEPRHISAKKNEVTVVIGAENQVEPLHQCSVVTASYYVGTRERGTLGVVGPTRMDYDRTIPAVAMMARNLSELLTRIA